MKKFLRDWVPPVLAKMVRSVCACGHGLKGPYASWAAACRQSDGYDAAVILEAVDRATARALATGQFSQDGTILATTPFPFPLAACLLRTMAMKGRPIHVMDFGGGLGSVWHRSSGFLDAAVASWSVVEQSHFVAAGREKYETSKLRFFETMGEAAAIHPPDAMVFSSVLQYIERPFEVLAEAAALKPVAIVIDRTPYGSLPADVILIQKVPPEIYVASYPLYIFGVRSIQNGLRPEYRRVLDFDAADGIWPYSGGMAHFRGEYYERFEG
jgi:putative methyltransferase (TIGR04325 family)